MRDYPIVTLCGSARFENEFKQVQKEFTLKGYIVLSLGFFGHLDNDNSLCNMDKAKIKCMLLNMHKAKINMADELFVINPNGYIGDSTWSEIYFAKMQCKKISFMENVSESLIREKLESN